MILKHILVFERLVPPQIPNRQATSSNPFERPTCSMGAAGASLLEVIRDGAGREDSPAGAWKGAMNGAGDI